MENKKWEFCEVVGYITACDPGHNNFSVYYKKYKRSELKVGMDLCAYKEHLPKVILRGFDDNAMLVKMEDGNIRTLHLDEGVHSPRHPLDYAYSDAEIRLINPIPSIKLGYKDVEDEFELMDKSKWWGSPDLPPGVEYPSSSYGNMTFICQIRCEDLAPYDRDGYFPKEGMLYFFADIDDYTDSMDGNSFRCSGAWPKSAFKVIYAPPFEGESASPGRQRDDGTWMELPAKSMTFSQDEERYDGLKVLGKPYKVEYNGQLCLLQLTSNKEWGLNLDGQLHFVMSKYTLKRQLWDYVSVYHFKADE